MKKPVLCFMFSVILLTILFLVFSVMNHGHEWRILKRWIIPWSFTTLCAMFAVMEISGYISLLVLNKVLQHLGVLEELRVNGTVKMIFLQNIVEGVVRLGLLFCMMKFYQVQLWQELFTCDVKDPFDGHEGWLLWAAIGFIAMSGISVSMNYFMINNPAAKPVAGLVRGVNSDRVSLICLFACLTMIAPLVEEVMFRGFLMTSMTKWFPTPVAVVISAAGFAIAHITLEGLPLMFVGGTVMGLSFAQTRKLLTPITIHSLWNFCFLLVKNFS